MKPTIRVLVVDDSPTVREILVSMLQSEPGFQVVGQARNGEEAVRLSARLRPDVITMDIRMPRMDGLQATRQIMSTAPRPIVVVAASVYDQDMNIAFNAIAAGALTVVEKPKGLSPANYEAVREQLVTTIRLMAEVPVVTIWPERRPPSRVRDLEAGIELIAIAASTGGPGVLRQILSALPGDLSVPIVVVQHITRGFAHGFASWLDDATELKVEVAKDNERVAAGRVLIAPDDAHMHVNPGGIIQLDPSPPVKGLRPSATRLFNSVAKSYGAAAVGVVLTGMGEDGVEGLENLRMAGGRVIAQNEESCVVFGMPKVAIEQGIVDQVLQPDEIASMLNHLDEYRKSG
jgi:two-component system chemotaxis response regulator CheB